MSITLSVYCVVLYEGSLVQGKDSVWEAIWAVGDDFYLGHFSNLFDNWESDDFPCPKWETLWWIAKDHRQSPPPPRHPSVSEYYYSRNSLRMSLEPQRRLPIMWISASHTSDDGSGSKMQSSMRCTIIALNFELIFLIPELALHHTIISMKNIRIVVIQCASGLQSFVLSLLIGVQVLI